jgi:hypothetical protein
MARQRRDRRQNSHIVPRFGPERLVVWRHCIAPGGTPVLSINPRVARLLPRLITQLVPAALVTGVGVMLLSNLGKTPSPAPDTPPVEVAINADSVFKITPREAVDDRDQDAGKAAGSRAAAKPKPLAANTVAPQSRKATEPAPRQLASAPAPLPIVPIPEQPQTAQAPSSDNVVVSKLQSATATVQRIPQWAARSVAGWFTEQAPPRPPAPVPTRNFQAAM